MLLRRLNRNVLRLLSTERVVLEESRLIRLSHPHLLPHLGVVTDGGENWGLLMPHEKRSLAQLLQRAATHEPTAASLRGTSLHMMADVAAALAHLHRNDVLCLCLRAWSGPAAGHVWLHCFRRLLRNRVANGAS